MTEQKNESRPTQPSDPLRNTQPTNALRASRHSIARQRRRAKRRLAVVALLVVTAGTVAALIIAGAAKGSEPVEAPTVSAEPPDILAVEPEIAPIAVVETCATARYILSPEERDLVERVVMAEAGGETFAGQMAVAQCILVAAEKTGTQPSEATKVYQYAQPSKETTQSVRDAVAAVFDQGHTVTREPILFFYAPKYSAGKWHETQTFVLELGGHRFFVEKGAAS